MRRSVEVLTLIFCLAIVYLIWPYLWKVVYLTGSETFLQSSISKLVERNSSEEIFIQRVQRRGFNVQMPTENPVRLRANGGKSYVFIDQNAKYQNYEHYIELWRRHIENTPKPRRGGYRAASFAIPIPPICSYNVVIHWEVDSNFVVSSSASKYRDCI